MAECYYLSGQTLILLSMIIALCVVLQALAVTFSFRRLAHRLGALGGKPAEIGMLLHLFLCAAMIAEVQYNTLQGFLLPSGYGAARQGVFCSWPY